MDDKREENRMRRLKEGRVIFNGKKQVTMFEMTKLVSGHVTA